MCLASFTISEGHIYVGDVMTLESIKSEAKCGILGPVETRNTTVGS